MKKVKVIIVFLSLVVLTSFKADNLPKEVQNLLDRASMVLDSPQDFTETQIIPNRQMSYDYAVKHKNKNFEIRYTIRPLDILLKTYNEQEKNKKPGDVHINPNNFYKASIQAILLNISGGKMARINEFPKEAIKAEFNADWGAMTIVEAGKEFGQDYKYCMLVAIHKDNIGDAYYFYLANDQETIQSSIESVFHSLRFK